MERANTLKISPRLLPGHLAAYGLAVAAAIYLLIHFLAGVQAAAPLERQGACLALDARPVDRPAPAWTLKDLNGKTVSLASLRGKVVMVNFWATWCPPCVEELPSMIQLAGAPLSNDFAMVMVSVDDTRKIVTEFMGRRFPAAKKLPILMDPGKKTATAYGTSKFPETYLVDREGNIRYWVINKRDWSTPEAKACINSLL